MYDLLADNLVKQASKYAGLIVVMSIPMIHECVAQEFCYPHLDPSCRAVNESRPLPPKPEPLHLPPTQDPPKRFNGQGYKYDVFYCQGNTQAQSQAQSTMQVIKDGYNIARLRVRPWSSTNSVVRDGVTYNTNIYYEKEIRVNADEYVIGEELRSYLQSRTGQDFEFIESGAPTHGYISIVVCPQ